MPRRLLAPPAGPQGSPCRRRRYSCERPPGRCFRPRYRRSRCRCESRCCGPCRGRTAPLPSRVSSPSRARWSRAARQASLARRPGSMKVGLQTARIASPMYLSVMPPRWRIGSDISERKSFRNRTSGTGPSRSPSPVKPSRSRNEIVAVCRMPLSSASPAALRRAMIRGSRYSPNRRLRFAAAMLVGDVAQDNDDAGRQSRAVAPTAPRPPPPRPAPLRRERACRPRLIRSQIGRIAMQ